MPKKARARNNRKKLQKFNPIKSVKVAKTTEHKPKPEANALITKNFNLDMRFCHREKSYRNQVS
jgi:hypothetical protein